jgi:hypothetical protein
MSFYHYYRAAFERVESLNFQQMALLTLFIVAFGFYCLRGFGSRSNY